MLILGTILLGGALIALLMAQSVGDYLQNFWTNESQDTTETGKFMVTTDNIDRMQTAIVVAAALVFVVFAMACAALGDQYILQQGYFQ